MSRPRLLLADDHRIVAEGLRSLLEPEFEIVGIVEDGRAMVDADRQLKPDVIVADISMPLLNGIDALRQLKEHKSQARVVLLTMQSDVAYATRAFDEGASGYVLKHSASSELVTAVREALKGRTFVTPMIASELMQAYRDGKHEQQEPARKLTSRQREVLQLLAEGNSAKEVAEILHISPRTVEFHKYRIMGELNLQTNAELIRYAIRTGIVSG